MKQLLTTVIFIFVLQVSFSQTKIEKNEIKSTCFRTEKEYKFMWPGIIQQDQNIFAHSKRANVLKMDPNGDKVREHYDSEGKLVTTTWSQITSNTTDKNIVYTFGEPGIYRIFWRYYNPLGTEKNFESASFTVYPNPSETIITADKYEICPGEDVTFTASLNSLGVATAEGFISKKSTAPTTSNGGYSCWTDNNNEQLVLKWYYIEPPEMAGQVAGIECPLTLNLDKETVLACRYENINADNNCSDFFPSIRISLNCPDLIIDDHSLSSYSVFANGNLEAQMSVMNLGGSDMPISKVATYFATTIPNEINLEEDKGHDCSTLDLSNRIYFTGTTTSRDGNVNELEAFSSSSYEYNSISLSGLSIEENQTYYIIYQADASNAIPEELKTNNCKIDAFKVIPLGVPLITADDEILCENNNGTTLHAEVEPGSDVFWYETAEDMVYHYATNSIFQGEDLVVFPTEETSYFARARSQDGSTWSDYAFFTVKIAKSPIVEVIPLDPIFDNETIDLMEHVSAPRPVGGIWNGNGLEVSYTGTPPAYEIISAVFNASVAGEGTHELTFTYTETSTAAHCTVIETLPITVLSSDKIDCSDCLPPFSPEPGLEYIISAWVSQDDLNSSGDFENAKIILRFDGAPTEDKDYTFRVTPGSEIIEDWQRIEGRFTVPYEAESIRIILNNASTSMGAYFDDIRVFPVDASFKSYVYDPITGQMSAELDENNYATFYEYDEEGRLIRIKKETERGIMTIQESFNNVSKQ